MQIRSAFLRKVANKQTERQTDRQTNQRRRIIILLGGGNERMITMRQNYPLKFESPVLPVLSYQSAATKVKIKIFTFHQYFHVLLMHVNKHVM